MRLFVSVVLIFLLHIKKKLLLIAYVYGFRASQNNVFKNIQKIYIVKTGKSLLYDSSSTSKLYPRILRTPSLLFLLHFKTFFLDVQSLGGNIVITVKWDVFPSCLLHLYNALMHMSTQPHCLIDYFKKSLNKSKRHWARISLY